MPSPLRPILITAGATRNPIDRMRFISAYSSGGTGAWLVRALAPAHPVHLLGHPEALLRATGGAATADFSGEIFGSTRDLLQRMRRWVLANPRGVVVHAAAVGDYEVEVEEGKVESGRQEWLLRLRPAPKIANLLGDWSPHLRLATFKAAPPATSTEELVQMARRQLHRTGSGVVFANVLGKLGRDVALVEADRASVHGTRGEALEALLQWVRRASQEEMARGAPPV